MTKEYYKENKKLWGKGGKYYTYQPKVSDGKLSVKRGIFWVKFD
tara:strand:+ start:1472 stop:1603 length:132 start_codon:yes stop_codon:yes gene_type:complete